MIEKVVVSLGSNSLDSKKILKEAINFISDKYKVVSQTEIVATDPFGNSRQNAFHNCLLVIETNILPYKLLSQFKKIENRYNKKKNKNVYWGERNLDLDIIKFGNYKFISNNLIIPHDGLLKRKYLQNLMENLNKRGCL